METIIILAQALSKAAKAEIVRLDINVDNVEDITSYNGRLWLKPAYMGYWDIYEDGTITHHK